MLLKLGNRVVIESNGHFTSMESEVVTGNVENNKYYIEVSPEVIRCAKNSPSKSFLLIDPGTIDKVLFRRPFADSLGVYGECDLNVESYQDNLTYFLPLLKREASELAGLKSKVILEEKIKELKAEQRKIEKQLYELAISME